MEDSQNFFLNALLTNKPHNKRSMITILDLCLNMVFFLSCYLVYMKKSEGRIGGGIVGIGGGGEAREEED